MMPSTSSNLSEALINVKKIEKNFLKHEYSFLDRDRTKIRANLDRHMETFLQLTHKRHETWYRHDKHFREALRKERDRHEKRKERNRQKLLTAIDPNYIPRVPTPFEPLNSDSVVLPPIAAATPRAALDESAARSRYQFVLDRASTTTPVQKSPPPPITSSSCSFASATLMVPMTTSIDCEEYDRLVNKSLERETFSDFVDHFIEFRPEYREQFGRIHEANKRKRAMEKLKEFNQIYAKNKDERYHNLISSLTDLRSEEKKNFVNF